MRDAPKCVWGRVLCACLLGIGCASEGSADSGDTGAETGADSDGTTGESLTAEEFLQEYARIVCGHYDACGNDNCVSPYGPGDHFFLDCEFDADAAQACLVSIQLYMDEQTCFALGDNITPECSTGIFSSCPGDTTQ